MHFDFKTAKRFVRTGLFHPYDFWVFHVVPEYESVFQEYFTEKNRPEKHWFSQPNSDIDLLPIEDFKCVIKKVRINWLKQRLRRYIGLSRGRLECKSSTVMRDAGICVPDFFGYGVNYSFFDQYESIFLCRFVEDSFDIYDFYAKIKPSAEERKSILRLIARDIAKMHKSNIFRRDCNRSNILFNPSKPDEICWIDNWAWNTSLSKNMRTTMLKKRGRDDDTEEERTWFLSCYEEAMKE